MPVDDGARCAQRTTRHASDLRVDPLSTHPGSQWTHADGHRTGHRTTQAPVPERDRGLWTAAEQAAGQRQRIDITRPATMAPKPIAKFQAPSEFMNPILSPAT
jgi:hypothetical protein